MVPPQGRGGGHSKQTSWHSTSAAAPCPVPPVPNGGKKAPARGTHSNSSWGHSKCGGLGEQWQQKPSGGWGVTGDTRWPPQPWGGPCIPHLKRPRGIKVVGQGAPSTATNKSVVLLEDREPETNSLCPLCLHRDTRLTILLEARLTGADN